MSRYVDVDYLIKKIQSRIGYFEMYYPNDTKNISELKICCDIVNDAPMLKNRMTTEKAINILHGIQADNLDLDDAHTKDEYEAIDMAIKALSAEKTAEWILVRKQKPEDYEEVIATVRYDYKDKQEYEVVTGVRYSKEDGWEWAYEAGADYYVSIEEEVVAWQPLPKPYEVKR